MWSILAKIQMKKIHAQLNYCYGYSQPHVEWYHVLNWVPGKEIHYQWWHIFFIRSSLHGPFGCFHALAIVDDAAVNIIVHISLIGSYLISFGYIFRSGILDCIEFQFLISWETAWLLSIATIQFYIFTNSAPGPLLLHIAVHTCYLLPF